MKKILVIFTCYNRIEKTKNCILSLRNNKTSIDYLIVDDNSSDGTREFLESISNIKLISGDGSLFYSGGMRVAIEEAKKKNVKKYDYVMMINDDVYFFKNSVDRLVEYEEGKNAIVVGAVCDDDGNFSYGGVKKDSKMIPRFRNVTLDDDNLQCDTSCANCVLIPIKIFEALPNIDSVYQHAMGDFDYFLEATRKGYRIISSFFYVGQCNDNPIQTSWRDTSLSKLDRWRIKESPKGLPFGQWWHFLHKNYGLPTAIIYSITPYIRILLGR